MIAKATRRQRDRMQRKPAPPRPKDLWRLPSGKRLAEFALASGFLAPPLLESGRSAVEKKEP